MNIKLRTTAKKIEVVNYVLAIASESLKNSEQQREIAAISMGDVNLIESFRKQLLNEYFKQIKTKIN